MDRVSALDSINIEQIVIYKHTNILAIWHIKLHHQIKIGMREIHSELYSTSGDFDLMVKLYVSDGQDIGMFINDNLLNIDGIERTYTIQTFKAF